MAIMIRQPAAGDIGADRATSPYSRRVLFSARLLCGLLGAMGIVCGEPALGSGEQQIKAAFLYNFAKFVEWPQSALPEDADRLIVGVLDRDSFAKVVAENIDGKVAGGRKVAVRHFRRAGAIERCHVLFIGPSEVGQLADILAPLRHESVLTVSDIPDFASRGGVISLRIEENKVRFRINVKAAERAGLKISSKLLRVADIVDETRWE